MRMLFDVDMRIRETAAVDENKAEKIKGGLDLCLELQSDVDGYIPAILCFRKRNTSWM